MMLPKIAMWNANPDPNGPRKTVVGYVVGGTDTAVQIRQIDSHGATFYVMIPRSLVRLLDVPSE